jgi:hypothetical protein
MIRLRPVGVDPARRKLVQETWSKYSEMVLEALWSHRLLT